MSRFLSFFQDSTYTKRTTNLVADKLARGARSSHIAVFYVDSIPLVWFSDPVDLLLQFNYCCQEKKQKNINTSRIKAVVYLVTPESWSSNTCKPRQVIVQCSILVQQSLRQVCNFITGGSYTTMLKEMVCLESESKNESA